MGKFLSGVADVPTCPNERVRRKGAPDCDARRRTGVSLTDLASVLWRSRELLEMLLFKLEEEQLLLAANRSR